VVFRKRASVGLQENRVPDPFGSESERRALRYDGESGRGGPSQMKRILGGGGGGKKVIILKRHLAARNGDGFVRTRKKTTPGKNPPKERLDGGRSPWKEELRGPSA